MNIFPVTEELLPSFYSMLPPTLSERTDHILGASLDGAPCGVIVLESMGHQQSLSWLWVEPEFRQKGVGSALLDQACKRTFDPRHSKVTEFSASWPLDAPWAPVLERILGKRRFLCKSFPIRSLRITRQELERSPLLAAPRKDNHAVKIVSFASLPQFQRNQMRMACEEAGLYQISRANYSLANHSLSHVLLIHGQIAGVALLRVAAHGVVSLDLFSIQKGHIAGGLALLQTAAQAALDHGMTELVFDSVEDSATHLASRLLGQDGKTVFLCRGRLPAGAYKREG